MNAPTANGRWLDEQHAPWLVVLAGLLVLYVPTGVDLFRGIWSTEQQGQGPIVLAVSLWLLYRSRQQLISIGDHAPAPLAGWTVLCTGGLLYALGRSQNILLFEVGSLIWMVAGCILLLRGASTLKALWFPLFFMVFMVPLPGAVVDALTLPMKLAVSAVTDHVLHALGYPISRSGVILQIGQYQLMVADACAGLHTLFSLEAMGLLYLNIVRHSSAARNILLAILIIPISFTANVLRVMVLTLITYHFGDAAGQGYLHGFAGMVLFMSALMLTIAVDSMLRWKFKPEP